MTSEQQASSTAPAPHQISERARLRLREAYRMIHDFAAELEEEERIAAEEAAAKEKKKGS